MSSCACGHHHDPDDCHPMPTGAQVALSGTIACADAAQMMALLMHVSPHVAATRAEPGCLHYAIAQTDDPSVWRVEGLFRDAAALAAHRARAAASPWGAATGDMARDLAETTADGV